MCIFPRHNLLTDPPFSKLDLLTCRNLQIDLAGVQNIIPLFHYALKPDGFLMLGTSEAEPFPDLFSLVDREHRIYSRRETVGKSFQFRTASAVTFSAVRSRPRSAPPARLWDVDAAPRGGPPSSLQVRSSRRSGGRSVRSVGDPGDGQ